MRRPGMVWALLALAILSLALAGCRRRNQPTPAAGLPAARLTVSEDFGARILLESRVPVDQSVLAALRGATDVRTAYGGGFVSELAGRRSDPGGKRDWFFARNGIFLDVGAREVPVRDGDAIWWDYRSWAGVMDVFAAVGEWPAPFAPAGPPVAADAPLREPLRRAGARLVDGDARWRVRVDASAALAHRDPTWRRALDAPDRAGLTAAVEDDHVTLLAPSGAGREPVAGGRALAVALPTGARAADGVMLAVVGLDRAAAIAAAEAIARRPELLRRRYAVVFDATGTPLRAAGRAGP